LVFFVWFGSVWFGFGFVQVRRVMLSTGFKVAQHDTGEIAKSSSLFAQPRAW
jgi:hypothetical protein